MAIFESKYIRLKDERDNVAKAKEALELQEASQLVTDDKMGVSFEELQDLKGVWSELSKIWEQIDEMKELPWISVQPRKLRSQIDALLGQLKDLPARLRQYASYEYVRKLLQSYAKVNILVVDLKSDALKERHWKTLCRQLRVNWILSDLSLGQVWDVNLQKNENVIKDVIQVARLDPVLCNAANWTTVSSELSLNATEQFTAKVNFRQDLLAEFDAGDVYTYATMTDGSYILVAFNMHIKQVHVQARAQTFFVHT